MDSSHPDYIARPKGSKGSKWSHYGRNASTIIAQAKITASQATGTANLSPLELAFYNRLVELNQHPTQHVSHH